jgi:tetratricopeptide (TPR) repeat protein
VAVVAIAPGLSAQAVPPLPQLSPQTYPEAARAPITRVYQNAVARPADAGAIGALARMLQAWEQWEAAHQAYARAQALAPRAFEWHYLDGVILQRLARHAEAAERFAAAVAVSPGYLPARVKLAEACFDAGDLDRSEKLFTDLTREPLAGPASQFGLGRIAATEGRHEAAVTHLQRAVELFPEFGAAYYALARSYRALGRSEEAQWALDRHGQFGPRWPGLDDPVLAALTTLRNDPRAELQRGLNLAAQGDIEGAIAAHEAAVAREPTLAQAHANLISLYARTRNWAKAEAHYKAVVASGFNLADAHYDYGVLLGMQDRWDEAAEAYRSAIAVNPRHARARNNLGQILERDRKLEEAAAEYRQALQSQPTFRLARFNLGRMLLALGRPGDAIVELQPIVEPRDAEAPRYLFALATAYVRNGDRAEGIRWAADARQLALQHKDTTLAAAIERELAALR